MRKEKLRELGINEFEKINIKNRKELEVYLKEILPIFYNSKLNSDFVLDFENSKFKILII